MFAPPPVQLSRAEIEARLAAKRQSTDSDASLTTMTTISTSTSGASSQKARSLQRNELRSSPYPWKNGLFTRGEKAKRTGVSSPVASSPGTPSRSSSEHPDGVHQIATKEGGGLSSLPVGFAEHPRPAPAPPGRPTSVPSALFSHSPPPNASPPPQGPTPELAEPLGTQPLLTPRGPIPEIPEDCEAPPPIPEKNPKRQSSVSRHDAQRPVVQRSLSIESSLSTNFLTLRVNDSTMGTIDDQSIYPPPLAVSASKSPSIKTANNKTRNAHIVSQASESLWKPAAESRPSSRLEGVQGAKIDKMSIRSRRACATAALRDALLDIYDADVDLPSSKPVSRRATDEDITRPEPNGPPSLQMTSKQRGETMSNLLDGRFFPEKLVVHNNGVPKVNTNTKLPPPSSLLDKPLPDTPTSIAGTPTEMYHDVPIRPLRPTIRKGNSRNRRRSPLAQIAATDAKNNSSLLHGDEVSPSRLSAIPEHAPVSENSSPPSGMVTRSATHVQLKGGPVLTVAAPELKAWKKSIYLHGPIKLSKSTTVPCKGSVASLEPFQDVIDQVYQEALNIPSRRSDDAVVDDVCEWIDEFGFEPVSFEGDVFGVEDICIEEMEAIDEETGLEIERFSTPPAEPLASPVEKVTAKEVIVAITNPEPIPKPPIPPVENEETLRTKGIARLSHSAPLPSPTEPYGRKDSSTISTHESMVLPLLPLLEEGVLEPSSRQESNNVEMGGQPIDQGFDWDDDIEEMDASSVWVAPAAFSRRHGLCREKDSRNPMKRMRRLVATASAIL